MDILLVEDNRELAQLLVMFLEKEKYRVKHVRTGEEALRYLDENEVQILILDIMLAGEIDGFTVCTKVREKNAMPILIISAISERDDQLTGYRLGADDFIEKPIDSDILVAKVNAQMARINSKEKRNYLVSGDLILDNDKRTLVINDKEISLNIKEQELLNLFILNKGKTLHKEYIFNEIWGVGSFSENQTLTVHINMLREKIEQNPRKPKRIHTIWGVGYRYEEI
ncbi:MAG: response regulator transcription factor [Suipraeoptans sp.]